MRFSSGVVIGLTLFSAALQGQETLFTLRGTATDSSGAVVPGVAVTVQEVATTIVARKVTTDNLGNYEIPGLKQGTYRLRAILAGFKAVTADDIILASNQIRRIDVR